MPATLLNISFYPAGVTAGTAVDLRITGLQLRSGRSVLSYSWTLVDGGGASVGFASSTNASTAALATTAAGTATLQVLVDARVAPGSVKVVDGLGRIALRLACL